MNRGQKLTDFEDLCRRRGLALTVQRHAIWQELLARSDHPTADDIYDSVRERVPGLSRTTVYRVLETLVEAGAAQKAFHPDAVARFDPIVERHHHLVCSRCGRLTDVDAAAVQDIRLPRLPGFTVTDYSINFFGVCSQCRKSTPSKGGKTWPKR